MALALSLASLGCSKINARVQIREANELYQKEQYAEALAHYREARDTDSSFPDLDRMIGYSYIGLFKPDDESPQNQHFADSAIRELTAYLQKRPDDVAAREALINLFLNANRTSEAIDYFREYLKGNPADLDTVKSIATLYAKQGNFNEALNWYEKITLLDAKNPESFYVYGVVCYEKVAKNPPEELEERFAIIEKGRRALQRAIDLRTDYFEANVYMNLLFREEAKVASDPDRQAQLMAMADQYRNRAIEINKARKKT
ncbi:MAG TPA: tetratricopeptide repeat protein [Thermoanaerobaculia bacterium]|nr:tetratricopeptide repeat protein [Thermoanaerobaculia bacterium]